MITIGMSYLPQAMKDVVDTASRNTDARNAATGQANERRGREMAQTFRVMESNFEIMNHAMSARVDFSV